MMYKKYKEQKTNSQNFNFFDKTQHFHTRHVVRFKDVIYVIGNTCDSWEIR